MNRLFLCLILIFSIANAKSIPYSSKYDSRVSYDKYNASNVFEVRCKTGYVTMIEFLNNERITNIATGFATGWELIDRDNFLFIKPKAYIVNPNEQNVDTSNPQAMPPLVIQPNPEDWKTNLVVTTNKNIYIFDLILTDNDKVNYKVQFKYPEEILKSDLKLKELEKEFKEENLISKELEKTSVPRNWDYYMIVNKNSDEIIPDFAYDDGVFTYLGFSHIKTIPSVFLYDEANNESVLNTHMKQYDNYDVLVIHQIQKRVLLRSGNKLVGIFNKGFGLNPIPTPQTTINKNISREVNK